MKSLFTDSGNTEIVDRINKLNASTPAQWGKMNVSQMMHHLQAPLKVGLNEMKLKRGLIGLLFGKMIIKKLAGDQVFDKNLPTHKNFIVKEDKNFEAEKKQLVDLVKRFGKTPAEEITKNSHPIFGKMNKEQWDLLQWKHLDHHLRQFGV